MFAIIFQFFFHFEFFGKKLSKNGGVILTTKNTGIFKPENTKFAYTTLACMLPQHNNSFQPCHKELFQLQDDGKGIYEMDSGGRGIRRFGSGNRRKD